MSLPERTPEHRDHLLIPKRPFYIGVTLFALTMLGVLVALLFGWLNFQFEQTPVNEELVSKLNSLETKINDTTQKMNDVFRLKEKIDQQFFPKSTTNKPGDGKGGLFQPIESLELSKSSSSLLSSLNALDQSMSKIDQQLPILKEQLNQSLVTLSRLPEGVPLVGEYKITSEFGGRADPFFTKSSLHSGVDFSAAIGTPVLAAAPGVVVKAVQHDPGFGNFIEIVHDKNVLTKYAHLDQILVGINDKVGKGSLIGTVGNTGRSTGSHLHFEVHVNNQPVDPMSIISPYPVKPNAASLGMYQASVQAKCANLKLIVKDKNSPLMKDCLARGGTTNDEIVIAKRANDSIKFKGSQKETGFANTNHCSKIDEENRLIIGTKDSCQ